MMEASIRRRANGAKETSGADRTERVCVGIATRGRSALITAVVNRLAHQTLRPTAVIVSATAPDDVADLFERSDVTVLIEQPGLARQRNGILRHLPQGTDIVVFFDDDFVPHANWLAAVVHTFRKNPAVAGVTGALIADGIIGPGIAFEDACAAADADGNCGVNEDVEEYSPYGCNMAFRCSAIGDLAFDERLVLYGWLEDRDFGGALARKGWRLVKIGGARGVHMGIKQGRMPGRKLGYSQVMNPAYMIRKGTATWKDATEVVLRNIAANVIKSVSPEPYVDRWGRLRGNAIAILDLCRGRLTPERAERL